MEVYWWDWPSGKLLAGSERQKQEWERLRNMTQETRAALLAQGWTPPEGK